MAYIVQIPEKDRQQIKEIFAEGRQKKEIKYLVTLYYRYCKVVDDYQKEIEFALSCGMCQSRVLNYFRRNQ
jgi:hypothetical protein